jgi:LPS-assembly protein
VMRRAPKPHALCGSARARCRCYGLLLKRAFGWLALVAVLLAVAGGTARAQSISSQQRTSSFPPHPGGMFGPAPHIDQAQPLYMQADQLLYDTKNSRVIAQGNVEIYYNNFILTADQVVYDQSVNKLIAEGNAQLKDPNGGITRADRFEALDDFRDAFIQSLSIITADETRIAAARAARREGNVTEYERAKFTPCKNDAGMPPLWCIGAARIIHDQRAATITYQDAQFELFGVPILYLPWFEHPDPSVKHRSGFLTPSFINSSTLGWGFEIPYYFALSPTYDFTLHPRFLSKEGVLWQGDWRQRLANGEYIINFSAIDQNNDDPIAKELGAWRGSVQTKGQFSLSSWWRYGWDVTVDSDAAFRRFFQLDPLLQTDRVNTAYLQGMSERNYFSAKLYQFGGLLLSNASVDPLTNTVVDTPFATSIVPVVDYKYIFGGPVLGGELSFTGSARSLWRNNDGSDSTHATAELNWRRKIIDPLGEVWTPFANVRGDVYSYVDALDPVTLKPIPNDTALYGVAATGLTYSYPFVAHTASAQHVIEPTAQIITRGSTPITQQRLPDEDAKSLIFDDTLLFETDKFSGYDRFETGTRINAGLQYTLQANNGFYARAVLGESYHIAGDNPFADPGFDFTGKFNFNPANGLETNRSDYVAGVYTSPFPGLSVISQARFSNDDWTLRRQDSMINGAYGPLFGSLAYTYSTYDPTLGILTTEQDALASLGLKLTNNWSVLGTLRYDITDNQTVQDVLQLKYADECFVLTASYIETFVTNPALNLVPDRTVMVRFELKHLGDFNYKTNALNSVFGDQNNLGPKL